MTGLETLQQSPADAPAPPAELEHRRPLLRSICDSLASLAVAIILVRGFLVEGYLISTGSMAPHLYGEHKAAVCPSCGTTFAVGTEFDDSDGSSHHDRAACPNCLYDEIEISSLPVDRGDHLLVWKNAFLWREPRRWEVAVFQNPNKPRETFIKRIAGLPGESLHIRGGNLFINGELARKPLDVQRACLLPVFDSAHQPVDEEWRPRWKPRSSQSRWTVAGSVMTSDSQSEDRPEFDWLDYRHTRRYGGRHTTSRSVNQTLGEELRQAFLAEDGDFPYRPAFRFPGVQYDSDSRTLSCVGVMSPTTLHRLLSIDPSPEFVRVVEELYDQSHFAPIDDFNAYNAISPLRDEHATTELLLDVRISNWTAGAELAVAVRIDGDVYELRFRPDSGAIELHLAGHAEALCSVKIAPRSESTVQVEVSSVDRQLSVAVDGVEALEPYPLDDEPVDRPAADVPVSVGVRRGKIEIARLILQRDIYYTGGRERHAVSEPYQLKGDEFFVLGDNSPVSSDSRSWHQAAVPRKLLVGKPFLVHLPSRTTQFAWGEKNFQLRVPDFSRIRFVR